MTLTLRRDWDPDICSRSGQLPGRYDYAESQHPPYSRAQYDQAFRTSGKFYNAKVSNETEE